MNKIVVARGIAMPFFPMRPASGRALRNKAVVDEFNKQVLSKHDWVVQPKLEGDRACIAVFNGEILIQNRHGGWYSHVVRNLHDFKKLPNGTVLDGEVFKGKFYPFECLASDGKSFITSTVSEREILAYQFSKFLGHEWKFYKPSKSWLSKLHSNAPDYGGVVLKRAASPYVILGSPNQASLDWLKRCWG